MCRFFQRLVSYKEEKISIVGKILHLLLSIKGRVFFILKMHQKTKGEKRRVRHHNEN